MKKAGRMVAKKSSVLRASTRSSRKSAARKSVRKSAARKSAARKSARKSAARKSTRKSARKSTRSSKTTLRKSVRKSVRTGKRRAAAAKRSVSLTMDPTEHTFENRKAYNKYIKEYTKGETFSKGNSVIYNLDDDRVIKVYNIVRNYNEKADRIFKNGLHYSQLAHEYGIGPRIYSHGYFTVAGKTKPYVIMEKLYPIYGEKCSLQREFVKVMVKLSKNSIVYGDVPTLQNFMLTKGSKVVLTGFTKASTKSPTEALVNNMINCSYGSRNLYYGFLNNCEDITPYLVEMKKHVTKELVEKYPVIRQLYEGLMQRSSY